MRKLFNLLVMLLLVSIVQAQEKTISGIVTDNKNQPLAGVTVSAKNGTESLTELGESTAARDVLFELQSNRDKNAIKKNNSGSTLINEILLERRKEFYGELVIDFLGLKRRQLPLTRGGNHPAAYQFSFAPNDDRLNLKIPQNELDTNNAISEADQNP